MNDALDPDEEDDEDEQPDTGQQVADPETRTIRLLSRACSTCVCDERDLMHLGDRREQFIDSARRADSFIVCHDTGDRTEHPAAICRGYYNRYRREVTSLRIATAFGLFVEVDPPAVGFVEGRMRAATD